MTTNYKECLETENRNRIATDLRLQSAVLKYQALLMEDNSEAAQQQVRAEIHALQDILLDSIAVQFHCIRHIAPGS